MKNVIVTGGAGFIGSHLCEELLKNGYKVINIDSFNTYYDPNIKWNNVEQSKMLIRTNNFNENLYKVYQGDIRDNYFLNKVFEENHIDIIIHLAAYAGVRPSIQNPLLYTDVNINGTVNLLEMSKKNNIKNFIFASSSSVYGNNIKVPFCESDNVDYPISPYAASKKAGELLCHTYYSLYDFNIACLRFFTVYGPRQRPDLAINKFTNLISEGKEISVYGDGTSERDYTYIDDIIDGIIRSIEWVCEGKGKYEIFNLGESSTITLDRMIKAIEDTLGIEAKINHMTMQPGDVERTFADLTKSKKILGYNPNTKFEEGIKKYIEWFKSKKQ